MTPVFKRTAIAISMCLLLLFADQAHALDARLKNIIVTNTRDDLLIYLTVEGAFTEDMQTAILSGVPTTFSFYVNLYRTRSLWFDKKLAELKITNTVKYDNLKNEFVIQRSWEDGKPIIVKSIEEAEKMMTEIDSLKVVPLNRLNKGDRYQIRTKAQLSKVTLPLYLHYVLFFVSMWDFETDWYTIDFIY
ncbi:MAG: DUF4390 domain-containing protein [Deltaproteobacteria bacterium]|nr:DUF4390 domain-containing protein [Deltaproteobacteria bacterium]